MLISLVNSTMKVTNEITSFDRPKPPIDIPPLPSQYREALEAGGDISNKDAQALKKNGGGRLHNDGNSAIELFLDDSTSMSTVGARSFKKGSFFKKWNSQATQFSAVQVL